MGLSNFQNEEEETEEQSDSDDKVSYIYIRSKENKDAYDAMSTSLGGDAGVREFLKDDVPSSYAEDQHDFFQQLVVHLRDIVEDDDYSGMLDFLMVDDENIAQYLDSNDEVREAFMERVKTTEDAQTDGGQQEEDQEEAQPADD